MTSHISTIYRLFDQPPSVRRIAGCTVIALDGRSGSGKTSTADALQALDPDLLILHVEDFYPGWDGLLAGIDRVVHDVLTPWQQGNAGKFRPWNWHSSQLENREIEVPLPQSKRVLIEGCGAGAQPIASLVSGVVWLTAPEEIRKTRALTRDGDIFRPHWNRWANQEKQLIETDGTPCHADLTINTDTVSK